MFLCGGGHHCHYGWVNEHTVGSEVLAKLVVVQLYICFVLVSSSVLYALSKHKIRLQKQKPMVKFEKGILDDQLHLLSLFLGERQT